jgi:hypothetical protein
VHCSFPFFGPTSSLPPRTSSRPIPRPCPLPHAYQNIAFCGRRRIVSDYLLISLSLPPHAFKICAPLISTALMQSSRNLLLHYDYSMPSFFSYQIRDLLFLLQVRVPFPCFLTFTLTCEYCSFLLTRIFFFGRLDQRSSLFCISFLVDVIVPFSLNPLC